MARDGSVRLTGLFPTRKGGMWTGTLRREEMEVLADMLGKALDADKQVTAILFSNSDGKAEYTIYIGEARDRAFGGQPTAPTRAAERPQGGRGVVPARAERPVARTTRRSVEPEDPDKLPF